MKFSNLILLPRIGSWNRPINKVSIFEPPIKCQFEGLISIFKISYTAFYFSLVFKISFFPKLWLSETPPIALVSANRVSTVYFREG